MGLVMRELLDAIDSWPALIAEALVFALLMAGLLAVVIVAWAAS